MQQVSEAKARSWSQMVHSPREMRTIAGDLANYIAAGRVIYFEGDLGAGKTTLIQGICEALRVDDTVLSPTFSILKPYSTAAGIELLHVDLYRIENPAELLLIGIEDFLDTHCAWLIEWPDRGADVIPPPDIKVAIKLNGSARQVNVDFETLL